MRCRALCRIGFNFQSPLHRGGLFNPNSRRGQRGSEAHFSPLFIGEVSSTRVVSGSQLTRILIFQSPLHRGGLFNRNQELHRIAKMTISVPSSSGSSLQRTAPDVLSSERPDLSVPSSSGRSLQLRASVGVAPRLLPFSPLFIGEVSSTV